MAIVEIYNHNGTTLKQIHNFQWWESYMVDEWEVIYYSDGGMRKPLRIKFWHTGSTRTYFIYDYLRLPTAIRQKVDEKEENREVKRFKSAYDRGYVVEKIHKAKLRDNRLWALLQYASQQPSNKDDAFSEPMDIPEEWVLYDALVPSLREDFDRRFTKQGKRKKRAGRPRKVPRKTNTTLNALSTLSSVCGTVASPTATVTSTSTMAAPTSVEVSCSNCSKRQTAVSGTRSTCSCGADLTVLKRLVPRKRKNVEEVTSGSKRAKAVDVDLTVKQTSMDMSNQTESRFLDLNNGNGKQKEVFGNGKQKEAFGSTITKMIHDITFASVKNASSISQQRSMLKRGELWQKLLIQHLPPLKKLFKEAVEARKRINAQAASSSASSTPTKA